MTITISGLVILVISIVGALLAGRNATEQPRQVRILRFALFFWLIAFVQLVIAALGYALLNR
jgi:hypothetical protein